MPLRISAILGFASTALGLFFGLNVVIERLLKPDLPLGYASLMTALLVFGGAQLAMLGVIGEYLGRLFLTVNRTPQFVVRDVVGAPRDPGAP
jgi:undecaprenyl-phosphate 4-deoxy-4-formamido-L-arabinose transferase